jgi:hypothetical protein
MTLYHRYKVYRNGNYLGDLPKVKSFFDPQQEINSAGTSITVTMGVSVDTSGLAPDFLMTESGDFLMTESGDFLVTERAPDVIGNDNDQILIRNGNKVKVIEYSDYWPNGKQVFTGAIKRIEASFGDTYVDEVMVLIYSDGLDLVDHVIPGSNSLFVDQSLTVQNDHADFSGSIGPTSYSVGWGQTFTVGVGVTNLAAIDLMLAYTGSGGSETFTISIYSLPSDYNNGIAPLATMTHSVSSATPTVYRFQPAFPLTVIPGSQLYALVTCTGRSDVNIYFDDSSSYTGGAQWVQFIGNPLLSNFAPQCLYFKTYYSTLTTTSIFPAQDPSTMLQSIVASYNAEGGPVTTAVGSVDLTGLNVPYNFSLATTMQGILVAAKLAPSDFFWYVDIGTNILYFKRRGTTADFLLTKGVHIDSLKLVSSIENLKNKAFLSGGLVGITNLFKSYSDAASISNYGLGLELLSDNRITDTTAADATGNSFIAANKGEQYQTQVTILASTMDISLFKQGKMIGFRGFGTFVDRLLLQIVRMDPSNGKVTLTLGAIPPRPESGLAQAQADITALQTIDNPAVPS